MGDSVEVSSGNNTITRRVTSTPIDTERTKAKQIKENLEKYEQLFGADEDAFAQPTTTRKELWSYYLYYNVRQQTNPRTRDDNANYRRVIMESVQDHILRLFSNQL